MNQLGTIELKFAELVWEKSPMSSAELVKLCEKEFNWKKSTTYTVLKRLNDKGIFVNENGTVRSLITKGEYYSLQSHSVINESFNGSLPAFIAAFTSKKELTKQEVNEIMDLIKKFEEE